jgi:hypothetical protein
MVNIQLLVICVILFVIAPLICYCTHLYNKWWNKQHDKRSKAQFEEFKRNKRWECYKCRKWMSIIEYETHLPICTGTYKEREQKGEEKIIVTIPNPTYSYESIPMPSYADNYIKHMNDSIQSTRKMADNLIYKR